MIHLRSLCWIAAALALAGCGSSPPVRYYTLGAVASPASLQADAPSIVVGPIGLPEAVDRLQIVRRIDGTRSEPADGHRWAGSLKAEMGRRLAAALASARGLARVVAVPQSSIARPDYTLPVDVLRLDADGFERVTLDAVWTLRRDGRDIASRRFTASETIGSASYEALATAHGRLIDALAREIAQSVPAATPAR
ncbi:PqiC family protein [Methyloversatilis sp. XJ19-13]|uniref:PqiC family protein n=1 Tax=Methyloversatilis sp. XJ19-13 TaxID=2963430 RepID=UPI00211BFC81|nr:PqiC family protein [Methyloversatilis sp. XJ19-13]